MPRGLVETGLVEAVEVCSTLKSLSWEGGEGALANLCPAFLEENTTCLVKSSAVFARLRGLRQAVGHLWFEQLPPTGYEHMAGQ